MSSTTAPERIGLMLMDEPGRANDWKSAQWFLLPCSTFDPEYDVEYVRKDVADGMLMADNHSLREENERLRAELAEARRPNLFWFGEDGGEDAEETLLLEVEQWDPWDGERLLEVRCARELPPIKYRVWWEEVPHPSGMPYPFFEPRAEVVPHA